MVKRGVCCSGVPEARCSGCWVGSATSSFARRSEGRGARACQAAFLTVLFVLGALHWVAFLDLGEMRMTVEDWPLQLMYGTVLKQAVTQHAIPWHTSREVLNTTRFLAIPETTLSPQALALAWLPVGLYALCNILLLYTAGFIGCLLIRRKYRLSAFATAVLFLFFNFNGFITSHVGVGHAWVLGYFFLPFFCLLTLNLAEGKTGLGAAAAMAFVLFAMLLQGVVPHRDLVLHVPGAAGRRSTSRAARRSRGRSSSPRSSARSGSCPRRSSTGT